MGRPLNKRFFGPAGAGYELVCNAYLTQAGASAPAYIIDQRSNSKYRVAEVTPTGAAPFVVGTQYTIATVGSTDFTLIGASSNTVGITFTATGVGAGTGTASETEVCIIVDATPATGGEMQVVITPENAATTVQATVTTTTVGGPGTALSTVVIANAGYGYWLPGTGVALAAGDGTVDYTVLNGSLATVTINSAGTTNTAATLAIADAPAANPPISNARIINARQVKSFNGTTYDWPIVAPLGPDTTGMPQADIGA